VSCSALTRPAERFLKQAQRQIKRRFHLYEQLAHLAVVEPAGEAAPPKAEEKRRMAEVSRYTLAACPTYWSSAAA